MKWAMTRGWLWGAGGAGVWPALWMLPTPAGQPMTGAWSGNASVVPSGLAYGGWPASGEIDIVEARPWPRVKARLIIPSP